MNTVKSHNKNASWDEIFPDRHISYPSFDDYPVLAPAPHEDHFYQQGIEERQKAVNLVDTMLNDRTKSKEFAQKSVDSLLMKPYPISHILRVLRDQFAAIDNQVRGTTGEHRELLIESLILRALQQ